MYTTQKEVTDIDDEYTKQKTTKRHIPKSFEYETKNGMLKYTVEINETTEEDCGLSISMSYESYTDGAAYFTIYEPDDIHLLLERVNHRLHFWIMEK
jgi:hypothetical protein